MMTAAVDRILPKDEDPGALDADVPEYIDRILQTQELRQMKDDFLARPRRARPPRHQRLFKVLRLRRRRRSRTSC